MKNVLVILGILSLSLSGCAPAQPLQSTSNHKSSEISKKKSKNSSKKVSKEETSELSSEVGSDLIGSFSDSELLEMANSMIGDCWGMYYGFSNGTYFEVDCSEGYEGYFWVSDSRISSLQDVENVWYERFSRRYPVQYMNPSLNRLNKIPFIEANGSVYALNCIDGIVGSVLYFDHIVQRSSDEVWFAAYWEGADRTIIDANQIWSFVFENGVWKFGQILK